MNKKISIIIFLIVAILGLFAVNQFLLPAYLYDCHCAEEYEATVYVCESNCPNDDSCGVNFAVGGQCDDVGFCWTTLYYYCIDSGQIGKDYWSEYCWDCMEW
jgi:hypothetical protein